MKPVPTLSEGNPFPAQEVQYSKKVVGPFVVHEFSYKIGPRLSFAQANVIQLGSVLFDSGPPNILETLRDTFDHSQFEQVYLTHHHEDHVGLVSDWRNRGWRGSVHAPIGSIPFLENVEVPMYRAVYWGIPDAFSNIQPLQAEQKLSIEDREFSCIDTRGHTSEHLAFVSIDKDCTYIISGDIVLIPKPLFVFKETDVPGWIESLERLLALPGRLCLLPAHGQVREDARGLIEELRAHLILEQNRVQQYSKEHPEQSFCEIAAALYQHNHDKDFSQGEISEACFVRGVLDPVKKLPAGSPCPV